MKYEFLLESVMKEKNGFQTDSVNLVKQKQSMEIEEYWRWKLLDTNIEMKI